MTIFLNSSEGRGSFLFSLPPVPFTSMSTPSPPIRIVLVRTSHPGNIGAAARSMKNMGLSELVLVSPKRFPDAEATARASGADDLLAHARVCSGLAEAVADCGLVIGASGRSRALDRPPMSPREAALQAVAEARDHPVALVFGTEHSGLSNEELDLCHRRLAIPVEEAFPSLNLAAAVMVAAYELRLAIAGGMPPAGRGDGARPATGQEMEGLYGHLERIMLETGFLDPDQPRQLMRRLRRLFQRARPDSNEINILRGILSAIDRYIGRHG